MTPSEKKFTALVERLDHTDRAEVRKAVDSLVELAREEPTLHRTLANYLGNVPVERRWPIAYALGQLPDPSQQCLETLTDALGSEDRDIRWATLQLLVRLGKKDGRVISLCLELLRSGNPIQRRMVIYCFRELGFGDGALQVQCLGDADPLVRVATVTALRDVLAPNKEVMGLISRMSSQDLDPRVRNAAASFMERFSGSGKKTPALKNKKSPDRK